MNDPIFIGGCSRSGTTMLASMLSSDKNYIAIPESHFKVDVLTKICPETNGLFDTTKIVRYFTNHFRYKVWCLKDQVHIEEKYVDLPFLMNRLALMYGKQNNIENFKTWIDHTPGNMQYAPILSQIFKNSKFIHIVRDGRGFASSVKKLDWGFHDLVIIGRYWRDTLIRDLNNEMALNHRVLRVYYEDLVNQPEKTLLKVCDFLGLQYSETMLNGNGFIKPTYTEDQHKLIGKGIHKNRATAWKEELTKREIELFETVGANMLTHLGYQTQFSLLHYQHLFSLMYMKLK